MTNLDNQNQNTVHTASRWLPLRWHSACFALLAICSFIAHELIKPKWNAFGFPSYAGYGKNVEDAAAALTLIAVTVFVLIGRRLVERPGVVFGAMIAAALGLLGIYYIDWGSVSILALILIGSSCLFAWLESTQGEVAQTQAKVGTEPVIHRAIACVMLVLGCAWFFLGGLMPLPRIDLHHQGEIITSALDLLSGGVPYRTYFLPHGLSDTGLALALIALTGSHGVGIIVLLNAVQSILSFVSLFLLIWGQLRKMLLSALLAIAVGLVLILNSPWMCGNLFPVLGFLLISRRSDWKALLGVGVLFGIGYLWRIDAAMFGLATIIIYLFCRSYYTLGYAKDGRLWSNLLSVKLAISFVSDLGVMLLGMALPLLVSRLAFGFPTVEWFHTTLVEVPRYHRDSTGFPMPIAWKHYVGLMVPGEVQVLGLPMILILGLGLIVFLLVQMRDRRLPLDNPRDRFFLIAALYSLFNLKSIMDRSDPAHILEGGSLVLLLVFCELVYRLVFLPRPGKEKLTQALGLLLLTLCSLNFVSSTSLNAYSVVRLVLPWNCDIAGLRASLVPTADVRQQMSCSTDAQADPIAGGVKQVRALLDANGVGQRQLLVFHSASLLYPMLDQKLPTKYYQLGWASSPEAEQDLVSELRRSHVRAFLQINGIGRSLAQYDVPDAYRLPIAYSYILSQENKGKHYQTDLGMLTIVDERDADK